MKTSHAAALCLFLVLALASCAPGKPRTEIRFTSLFGEIPTTTPSGFDVNAPAPLALPAGVVYIQTGYDADAAILGPYRVEPGKPLVCSDIPPGVYSRLVLFYAPEAVTFPPVFATDDRDFWSRLQNADLASGLFADSGAAVLFGDITITAGKRKVLQATFIPFTSLTFDPAKQEPPVAADTAGALRKQFIRLEPGDHSSIYVMLSPFDGEGITYAGNVSLYDASGALMDTKALNAPITAELPASVLFKLTPGRSAYLYIEYRAKGNRKFDLSYF